MKRQEILSVSLFHISSLHDTLFVLEQCHTSFPNGQSSLDEICVNNCSRKEVAIFFCKKKTKKKLESHNKINGLYGSTLPFWCLSKWRLIFAATAEALTPVLGQALLWSVLLCINNGDHGSCLEVRMWTQREDSIFTATIGLLNPETFSDVSTIVCHHR